MRQRAGKYLLWGAGKNLESLPLRVHVWKLHWLFTQIGEQVEELYTWDVGESQAGFKCFRFNDSLAKC